MTLAFKEFDINNTTSSTTAQNTLSFSQAGILLRLEGLVLFVAAIVAYVYLRCNGWLFAALLLVPDVSMLGYLVNVRMGATLYNLVHIYLFPAILLALSLSGGWTLVAWVAIIWFAHIGMDRTVGYGLKYPTTFKDTHFNHV